MLLKSSGVQKFPHEYIEFLMMKSFGWTPTEIRKLSEREYQMINSLMLAEANAGRMKAIESQAFSP